jgi:NUMOD3 motif
MQKGKYVRNEEVKQKQSKSMRGKSSWNKGKRLSEETKSKMSFSKRNLSIEKECPQCKKNWIAELYRERNKKFCSSVCYFQSRKGHTINVGRKASNETKEKMSKTRKGRIINPDIKEFKRYKGRVHRLSSKNYIENIHIINPNNYPRTRCGIEGGYQLDHIMSVKKCFDNGISEEDASRLENLQLLPWKDNLNKGEKN